MTENSDRAARKLLLELHVGSEDAEVDIATVNRLAQAGIRRAGKRRRLKRNRIASSSLVFVVAASLAAFGWMSNYPSGGTTPIPAAPPVDSRPPELSEEAAAAQLLEASNRDASAVAGLAGSWVPQIMSLCTGVKADIGPNWSRDGIEETANVTSAQILTFATVNAQKYSALIVRPTQVGIDRDRGSRGACSGLRVWLEIVPHSYESPAAANAWCDMMALPLASCGARYVAPGGVSLFKVRY